MAETALCTPQPAAGKWALVSRTLGRPFRSGIRRSRTAGAPAASSSQPQASALPRVPAAVAPAPVPAALSAKATYSPSNSLVSATPSTSAASSSARRGRSVSSRTAPVDEWEARRTAEREFVLNHDTSTTEIWYLVDVTWLTDWKRFVSQAGPPPGLLRPEAIIDRKTGRPRPGLQPIHHYRGVNADVWNYWVQRYGGGPPIRRRKLDLYAAPIDAVEPMPETPPPSTSASSLESPDKARAPAKQFFGSLRSSKTPARRPYTNTPARTATPSTGSRAEPIGLESCDEANLGGDSSGSVFFVREQNGCIVSQPPDGSCLFHSLSFGLDDGSDAASSRLEISTFIAENPDLAIAGTALKDWVKFDSGGGVDAYAADIAGGTWGGGIEMEVFVRLKGVNVHVYEGCLGGYRRICCFDGGPKASRIVNVLYRERGSRGMEHYDALLLGEAAGQWLPRSNFEPGASGGA